MLEKLGSEGGWGKATLRAESAGIVSVGAAVALGRPFAFGAGGGAPSSSDDDGYENKGFKPKKFRILSLWAGLKGISAWTGSRRAGDKYACRFLPPNGACPLYMDRSVCEGVSPSFIRVLVV